MPAHRPGVATVSSAAEGAAGAGHGQGLLGRWCGPRSPSPAERGGRPRPSWDSRTDRIGAWEVLPSRTSLPAAARLRWTRVRTYEVRTYGCQMNVHDSERISGLLDEAGYVPVPRTAARPTSSCSTPAPCARTPTTASTATSATSSRSRTARPGMQIAVGGCLAQKDQGLITDAGALGRRRLRHPQRRVAAGAARARPRRAGGAGRAARVARGLPVDAAGAARVGVRRLGVASASAATTPARSASCRACAARSRTAGPATSCARSRCSSQQGVLEVTLLGQNVNCYGRVVRRPRRVRRAAARGRDDRRARAGPLHQPAPARLHRRRHRGDGRDAGGLPEPAHAAAVRLRRGAQGDAPLATAASASSASSTGSARRSPTPRSPPTSSSASPARPTPTSRTRCACVEASRFAGAFTFQYSPRPGTPAADLPRSCPRRSCRSATSGSSRCRSGCRTRGCRPRSAAPSRCSSAEGEGRKDTAEPADRPRPRQPARAPAAGAAACAPATSSRPS